MRANAPFKPKRPTERDAQENGQQALRLAGFIVRHTSAWRQKGPSGVSRGIADLLVKHPACDLDISLELEYKRPGKIKYTSEEQRFAHEKGYIRIAQTDEEALRWGRHFVERFAYPDEKELALERIDRIIASLAKGPKVAR